ncbi:transporter substrate-binding domain-containing protein [Radiobacillus kanasensis]|uniref:transporter substrate-binding domain-containing protein n=1 Tax=Radiobacillus kanasensis TaxID=2844358 RepID=UPI001E2B90C2|nr:transporter substrate-binding domain-containing protein [Radiobacillus kanasensis]UFU00013.1 transporter substrate-binding domain-containing protein [Radiobacillus kanasensis]
MKLRGFVWVLLLGLFLLAACGATNEGEEGSGGNSDEKDSKWAEIEDAGELVVATSGTLFPASYYPEGSDVLTGYDVEIMNEIGKRLDLDIKYETIGVDGMLAAVSSGRVDMVINDMEVTEERQEKFSFSEPYKYSYSTMIVRAEDLSGIEKLEDLEGKRAGGGATTVFSQIAEHFGAEVVTYGNATNDVYLRDVDNGRTDLIINDYYLQSLALQAMPEFDLVLHPDLKFHPTDQAIVLPKDAATLKEKVDGVLQEMREDGTLTELSKQFFGGKDASKKPEEEITKIEGLDL